MNRETDLKKPKRVYGEIGVISNLVRQNFSLIDASKEIDRITKMHGFIIGFIYKNRDRDIFQKDIEEEFSCRKSTVSSIVTLMEEKGLITRESVDYDARLKKIVLTDKAVKLMTEIDDSLERLETKITEGIAEEDIEVFFRVTEKIKSNLNNQFGKDKQ